jgi:predicted GIY-YIG superfamily endonuclease
MFIYLIEFLDTNYFYIGSTKHIKQRESTHLNQLNKNKHVNKYLQNVFNQYPDKYLFRIIDSAKTHVELLKLEQSYIDTFQPPLNMSKKVTYPTGNRPSKLYEVINDSGLIIKTNKVVEFCKKHNIDFTDFYKVARGERCSCKGWRIISIDGKKVEPRINKTTTEKYKKRNKEIIKIMQAAVTKEHREKQSINSSKRYLITTPDEIQFCVIGLNWFCKQHDNLDVSCLAKLAKGKMKNYKGYLCEEIMLPESGSTPKVA